MPRRHAITVLAAAVVLSLGVAGPVEAQSKKVVAKKHACCVQGKATEWPLYNKGIHWEASLEEARKVAREKNRPILYHVLVGDMNKEGT